jgi:hypothetical protein
MLRSAAMTLRYLHYLLWFLPVPVFVCLAVAMLRRKLHTRWPLFFAYAIFQVADFAIGFYFYHRSQTQYFYSYWTTTVISVGLGFGVIYEVFTEVFRPFVGLRDLGKTLFRWATLVMILAVIVIAAATGPTPRHPIFVAVLTFGRSIRIMQCGLVLLMILCSSYLGLHWRNRIFGISLGFGLIAATDLVVVTLWTTYNPQATWTLSLIKMAAYNFAALLWTAYMLLPEPARKAASQMVRADQWNFALASAVHPTGSGPALPLIESAVERIFEKTNGKKNGNHPPQAGAAD